MSRGCRKMNGHASNQSTSGINKELLSRIVELRRRECAALEKSVVEEIVENERNHSDTKPPENVGDSYAELNWLFRENLSLAGDERLLPSKRRQAWQRVKHLLDEIDKHRRPQSRVSEQVSNGAASAQMAAATAVRRPSGSETSTPAMPPINLQQTDPGTSTTRTSPLHRTNEMAAPQADHATLEHPPSPRAQGTSGGEGPHRFRAIITSPRKEMHGHGRSVSEPRKPPATNLEHDASRKPPPTAPVTSKTSKPPPAPTGDSSSAASKKQAPVATDQALGVGDAKKPSTSSAQNGSSTSTLSRKHPPATGATASTTSEAQRTLTASTNIGSYAEVWRKSPPSTNAQKSGGTQQQLRQNAASKIPPPTPPPPPPTRPPFRNGGSQKHQNGPPLTHTTNTHNYYGPQQTSSQSNPRQDTSCTSSFQQRAISSTRAAAPQYIARSGSQQNASSRWQQGDKAFQRESSKQVAHGTSPTSAARGPDSLASRWVPPPGLADRRTQSEGVRQGTSPRAIQRAQSEASQSSFRAIGDGNPSKKRPSFSGGTSTSRAPSRTGQSDSSRDATSVYSKNGVHADAPASGRRSPPSAAFTELNNLRDIVEKQKAKQQTIEVDFLADRVVGKKPAYSACLKERPAMRLKFSPKNPRLEGIENFQNEIRRLEKWDPFWKICGIIDFGMTSKVDSPRADSAKTAAELKADLSGVLSRNAKASRALLSKVQWGEAQVEWKDGDVALLFRMLPFSKDLKKRADYHLWPKGTFLQISGRENGNDFKKPVYLEQRKQQVHDDFLWKGRCNQLDVAQHIKRPSQAFNVQICCYDDRIFYYCLSFCQYRSPETVYNQMMCNERLMTKLSREESTRKALSLVSEQMVVLHSDEEEEEEEVGKFVFTLTCPISKTVMKTPVRGNSCKHFQCFDLQNFLELNRFVSGSRWRCASCEKFIPWRDLQFCGLTADLLHEFKDEASPQRDRIQFNSDRTYRLLEEAKKRNNGKKRTADGAPESTKTEQPSKKPKIADEVIIL